MRADDEGFINNPKKIQRMIGASDDDLKLLEAKNFIIPFESGVVVIKHWKIHNYIRGDRLHVTKYYEERAALEVKENGAYTLTSGLCQTVDGQVTGGCHTEVRLGKDSIDKDNKNISNNILPANDKTIFITIPLNDKTEYPVYDDDVKEYKSLYPAVDVEQQLRNMKGWCDANPSKRKTSKGIKRFITSWLCREQDRGGTKQEPRRGFDANKGIMSAGYDFATLEAEVRNRGNNENI